MGCPLSEAAAIRIPLNSGRKGYAVIDSADLPLVGAYPWTRHPKGYAITRIGTAPMRRRILMHRLILGLTEPSRQTDHINHDKLDNRRCNLREVTAAQNNQNVLSKPHSSVHRNVSRVLLAGGRIRWVVRVKVKGRSCYIGTFDDETMAAGVATEARRRFMPFAL